MTDAARPEDENTPADDAPRHRAPDSPDGVPPESSDGGPGASCAAPADDPLRRTDHGAHVAPDGEPAEDATAELPTPALQHGAHAAPPAPVASTTPETAVTPPSPAEPATAGSVTTGSVTTGSVTTGSVTTGTVPDAAPGTGPAPAPPSGESSDSPRLPSDPAAVTSGTQPTRPSDPAPTAVAAPLPAAPLPVPLPAAPLPAATATDPATDPATAAEPDPGSAVAPVLTVIDAGLRGHEGWAFRNVELNANPGELVAVVGSAGSGRSTLLLAIAGRMRLTTGSVDVLGHILTGRPRGAHLRAVRRGVAVARITDLIGLDPDHSVAKNLRDTVDWTRGSLVDAEDRMTAWREEFGLHLDPRATLGELSAVEQTAAHLLMAAVSGPQIIVLDDLDEGVDDADRERLWTIARGLTRSDLTPTPITVVTSVLDPSPHADVTLRLGSKED